MPAFTKSLFGQVMVGLVLGIIAGVVGAFLTLGARNAGGRHRNDEIDWDEVDQGASSRA